MARHRLATNTDARPEDAVATYLSDVAAQLYGPRRRRAAILADCATAWIRPPKTTSPQGYHPTRPRRPLSPGARQRRQA